jgi:excisionase family DNA binding protein
MDPLWTTDETAAYLRLHTVTLRRWRHERRDDQPPFVRVGAAVRYRAAEVEKWARSREERPGGKRKK